MCFLQDTGIFHILNLTYTTEFHHFTVTAKHYFQQHFSSSSSLACINQCSVTTKHTNHLYLYTVASIPVTSGTVPGAYAAVHVWYLSTDWHIQLVCILWWDNLEITIRDASILSFILILVELVRIHAFVFVNIILYLVSYNDLFYFLLPVAWLMCDKHRLKGSNSCIQSLPEKSNRCSYTPMTLYLNSYTITQDTEGGCYFGLADEARLSPCSYSLIPCYEVYMTFGCYRSTKQLALQYTMSR